MIAGGLNICSFQQLEMIADDGKPMASHRHIVSQKRRLHERNFTDRRYIAFLIGLAG
jgi:hypothetical protein